MSCVYVEICVSTKALFAGWREVTGGYDWTARLWDARSGAELRRFLGHRGAVYGVAVGARVLATGSYARGGLLV